MREPMTDDPVEDWLTLKWVADGAATLAQVAECLRDFAAAVEQQAADGWRLENPVEDGVGILVRPRPIEGDR